MREHFIEFFRNSGFICFPITYHKKIADYRYNASKTDPNQIITVDENYGIIPTVSGNNCIIDFDSKELYRTFCMAMIEKGYMIIESPHGWHMPVIGVTGTVTKIKLYDYSVQEKQIIEIQDCDHYAVGAGSIIEGEKKDNEEGMLLEYRSVGTEIIWNAKGKDFHEIINDICLQCHVTSVEKSRSTLQNYRKRFKKGIPPSKGTSNDYFFQGALQCNTDGLDRDQAIQKMQEIYDKWSQTSDFSNRPFSNIEAKVNEVYDKGLTVHVGRPKGSTNSGLDRTLIAQTILTDRKLYTDPETRLIFENKNGFLEKINSILKKELFELHPILEQTDYDSILFKLGCGAENMPLTNKNLIVFKNGVFNIVDRTLLDSDEIADMGFKDYNYLPPIPENVPTQFKKIMFDNVPPHEYPRVKMGLRSILSNYLDPKITVIHGNSGVGKSTGLVILIMILKDYALTLELDQLLTDKFIKAKTKNKRLLVLQDMPSTYKDFSAIKALTGEQQKTERGFMQDAVTFENKLKIWGTGNYLAKIPENEKNAMYSRRLSLIHNIRQLPYPEDSTLVDRIVKEEGEKIISWILNLPDAECKYEDSITVRNEWETLASPELEYLNTCWDISTETEETSVSVMSLKKNFEEKYQIPISLKQFAKALEEQGFIIKFNAVKNIKEKQRVVDKEQEQL
jgi:ABC-type dipeptide/oligopeptide/nickel transport system ATPase subunit